MCFGKVEKHKLMLRAEKFDNLVNHIPILPPPGQASNGPHMGSG